ncbi:MAG: Hsp33 family molecular chaperone HslO [Candidatus Kapabacteria bacterium]|nr:Hsp33 family molecular chaperone HslO [Candidatus Kapabacteria bacterium]
MNEQNEELKKIFQQRDRSVRVLSKDGFFRAVCVKSSNTSLTAQRNHKLDKVSAFFLSRMMSSSLMIASFLKGEERVVIEVDGSNVFKKLFAESMQLGEVRGYVDMNNTENIYHVNDISEIIGSGSLRITKILYHKAEPIQGIVPLVKGDIADDLAYYFVQSEQIPTAVVLDVEFDDSGEIKHSGGLMVQAMPGFHIDQLQAVLDKLENITPLSDYFSAGLNPKQIMKEVLPFEFDVINSTQVDFFCRCSKEMFLSKLLTLGAEEIKSMKSSQHNELVCKYCNKHYYIQDDDFDKLIEESLAKTN